MPSSSGVTSTLLERRSEKSEPALTPATEKKILLLPELRCRQFLKQQQFLSQPEVSGNESTETKNQSSDQVAEPELITPHTSKNDKASTTTRYTISGGMPRTATMLMDPQIATAVTVSQSQPLELGDFPGLQSSIPILITDFNAHRGEKAVIRPPTIGDDLNSRLEGLRQFKDWSARINESLQESPQVVTHVVHHHWGTPADITPTTQKPSPSKIHGRTALKCGERIGFYNKLGIIERDTVALTPFCSPQATPVPLITAKNNQQEHSVFVSGIALPDKLPQNTIAYARSRTHSKTFTISSETSTVQLTPASIVGPPRDLQDQAPQRTNSKPKTHPPVSFPKDFYERFPTAAETSSRSGRMQYSQPQTRTISSVYSRTPHTVSENDDALVTRHDPQSTPEFDEVVHYFTDCPHSHPPANRPLDANGQPRQDPNFKPTKNESGRSIISGACFDCDLACRRAKEDDVIGSCAARLAELADELAEALNEIELDNSDDDEAESLHDKHSARILTPSRFAEDENDLDLETHGITELPPLSDDPEVAIVPRSRKLHTPEKTNHKIRVVSRIRMLEVQIQRVHDEQEEEIKKVWYGFTPRWGPGTLGVQRCGRAKNTGRAALADNESAKGQPQTCPSTTIDAVQSVESKTTTQNQGYISIDESGTSSSIRHITFGSRSRESSHSRSRSRDTTPSTIDSFVSPRDPPGSRTPGKGKMKVGWIRDGKD